MYVLRVKCYVLRVTKYVLCFMFYVLSVTFYFCVLRLCLTLTVEVFFCRFHYGDYFVKYAFHVFVDGCEHGGRLCSRYREVGVANTESH